MSWPCRLLPARPENPEPGDMWPLPWLLDSARTHVGPHPVLSPEYIRDRMALRAPLCVQLPSGDEFIIDSRSSNGEGWAVTGDAPRITVSPSIACRGAGQYHGYLQSGVLTDDCEGRTYGGANGSP